MVTNFGNQNNLEKLSVSWYKELLIHTKWAFPVVLKTWSPLKIMTAHPKLPKYLYNTSINKNQQLHKNTYKYFFFAHHFWLY